MALSPSQTAPLFLTSTIFTTFVAGAALKNITLTVPDGTSNHGNPNLLCTPITASDIIIFYLGNYVAHAATVVTLPGEKRQGVLVTIILSLLFPLSGIMRGLDAIACFANHGKNDLQKAARAGALCMVIRSNKWKPVDGDKLPIGLLSIRDNSEIETDQLEASTSLHVVNTSSIVEDRTIHGFHKLPEGYVLAFVPRDASFSESTEQSSLPCGYSATKVLVALGQSIYASSTIYSARGDQIARYGYAAFGLTVAPFAIMSIINLLGNLMTPTYPAVYMVRSSIMLEAQKRPNCNFEGVMGTLHEESIAEMDPYYSARSQKLLAMSFQASETKNILRVTFSQPTDSYTTPSSFLVGPNEEATNTGCFIGIPSQPLLARKSLSKGGFGNDKHARLVYGLALFVIAIQFAIIGGLTRFYGGQSTHAQKSWIITWFVFGIAYGFLADLVREQITLQGRRMKWWGMFSLFGWFSPAPAIGGFVVVGQMLSSFGSCVQIF